MALRNIPVIEQYAGLLAELSPNAWLFNFTNPAGLVTQALYERGFSRAIGICDGANVAHNAVAKWLDAPKQELYPQVFGLNHLSWTRQILRDGQDVLAPLLRDPAFLAATAMKAFDPELVEQVGMWINEYLFYYYYAERAVEAINNDEVTRGEEILRLYQALLEQMEQLGKENNPQALLKMYLAYEQRRKVTYMHYARPGSLTPEQANRAAPTSVAVRGGEGEGYAGVALDVIQALQTNEPLYTALNVANQGAIDCLKEDDVIEVSCVVAGGRVCPLPVGAIPEDQELLIRAVKRYERLTVQAIHQHSRALAVHALMAHPLVQSFSRATVLVDEYLAAHRDFVGEWH
jgi:6-phospho-beta-glucosidase